MVNITLYDEVIALKCIHGNEIKIELVLNDEYWDDGAYIELNGCESCLKEIEESK